MTDVGCCGIVWGIESHEPWCKSIDAAWEAAEGSLPEWWRIRSLIEVDAVWEAVAFRGNQIRTARGVTPAAALRALIPAT